jgi:hypothetical protein
MKIIETSEATLAFAAGYLAGRMDHRFGGRPRWTMRVYMDSLQRPLSPDYLHKLETAIAARWPETETPPSLADILAPRPRKRGTQ